MFKHWRDYVIFIGLAIIMVSFIISYGHEMTKEPRRKDFEKLLGDKVVLVKDTLMITDYNLAQKTFYLSNGARIKYEIARKHLLQEK